MREWLHEIFRTAVAFGVDATVLSVRIEDRQIDANVEGAVCTRVAAGSFSGGNLPPKRPEILRHLANRMDGRAVAHAGTGCR
ncbi:MAG: hypothetical protein IPP88_15545 [Betaproteobacteria bacterium]|nr:hypothetical protein [Betaproteobacteria bacterium]